MTADHEFQINELYWHVAPSSMSRVAVCNPAPDGGGAILVKRCEDGMVSWVCTSNLWTEHQIIDAVIRRHAEPPLPVEFVARLERGGVYLLRYAGDEALTQELAKQLGETLAAAGARLGVTFALLGGGLDDVT